MSYRKVALETPEAKMTRDEIKQSLIASEATEYREPRCKQSCEPEKKQSATASPGEAQTAGPDSWTSETEFRQHHVETATLDSQGKSQEGKHCPVVWVPHPF